MFVILSDKYILDLRFDTWLDSRTESMAEHRIPSVDHPGIVGPDRNQFRQRDRPSWSSTMKENVRI